MSSLLCLLWAALSAAHSIIPNKADSTASSSANACVARLVRRTSKSTACLPDGDTRGGGRFGCVDNSTVQVSRHCSGLFQCGNGYTTLCPKPSAGGDPHVCICSSPCHKDAYLAGDLKRQGFSCPPTVPPSPLLPPLPPVPPLPPPPPVPPLPPPPPVDPAHTKHADVAGCDPSCTKREEGSPVWCKCAACSTEPEPLAMGAPCHHGHAPHHVAPRSSSVDETGHV